MILRFSTWVIIYLMVCPLRIELRHSGLQPDALPTELKTHINLGQIIRFYNLLKEENHVFKNGK